MATLKPKSNDIFEVLEIDASDKTIQIANASLKARASNQGVDYVEDVKDWIAHSLNGVTAIGVSVWVKPSNLVNLKKGDLVTCKFEFDPNESAKMGRIPTAKVKKLVNA